MAEACSRAEVKISVFSAVALWAPEHVIMWFIQCIQKGLKVWKSIYFVKTEGMPRPFVTFELSNRRIPKITGRYKGLERNKRFCKSCNDNCLGDEAHVLFEYKNRSFIDNRNKYLPKYLINHPSMFKLLLLLRTDKSRIVCKLGALLSNALLPFKLLSLC